MRAIKDDRQLFMKLAILAKHRTIDTKLLMQYELSHVPWSIANGDGTLVCTPKSKLLQELEKDVPPLDTVPNSGAVLVDAMALLQSLTSVPATFGDLSTFVFDRLVATMTRCV